ncbi:hypothetical protein D910_11759 [Dendroctonus ponderosae]|uniref:DUF4817 domain-containing protein n=1 Tax=Dendroctonus ponderosae TaxID=77166 RepID=U4UMX6_DENPD|nr:hypothetical protein D910_11759 [Dendroctonus ponderosae]
MVQIHISWEILKREILEYVIILFNSSPLVATGAGRVDQHFEQQHQNAASTFRALRADYGRHNRPTEQKISNTVEKFEETGSVTDIARHVHHRSIRSAENVTVVAQSVEEDPNSSILRRAQHLGLTYASYSYALLQEKAPGRGISRLSDVNWPARSCDLTPLDFFLQGYAKDRVYANIP